MPLRLWQTGIRIADVTSTTDIVSRAEHTNKSNVTHMHAVAMFTDIACDTSSTMKRS